VVAHFAARGVRDTFVFHPGNGGYRRPVESAILRGLGLVAGVPDLIIVHEGRFFGLELKSDGGRLSEAQKAAHAALRAAGATVAVAYGLDAAIKQLEQWHLLRGDMQ
jgi:hypothetical protein